MMRHASIPRPHRLPGRRFFAVASRPPGKAAAWCVARRPRNGMVRKPHAQGAPAGPQSLAAGPDPAGLWLGSQSDRGACLPLASHGLVLLRPGIGMSQGFNWQLDHRAQHGFACCARRAVYRQTRRKRAGPCTRSNSSVWAEIAVPCSHVADEILPFSSLFLSNVVIGQHYIYILSFTPLQSALYGRAKHEALQGMD